MAIVTVYLPLQSITAVTNGNAYDVTVVGGASALTSQDSDSSYVRFPPRPTSGAAQSYVHGTFPALTLPAGAVILDTDLYVEGKSETGATFAYTEGWVYTGAYGTGQSVFFSNNSGTYVPRTSGISTGVATEGNLTGGLLKAGISNYFGSMPAQRITYAALRVVYSDAPPPDGIPPANQTIEAAIPLPASPFVVDGRDIDHIYGSSSTGVFYTYTAEQRGHIVWWLDYAEDPTIWQNELTIHYSPFTEADWFGFDVTYSYMDFDEDPGFYQGYRYGATSEILEGQTLHLALAFGDTLPGPYTVRWQFNPAEGDSVPALGGNSQIVSVRKHEIGVEPPLREWDMVISDLREDGTINVVRSAVFEWPTIWDPPSQGSFDDGIAWNITVGSIGESGRAVWYVVTHDYYGGAAARNRVVAIVVRYDGTVITFGEPLLLLEIASGTALDAGGTQHSFSSFVPDHGAGGGGIAFVRWQYFDDPDGNNFGTWVQRHVTLRVNADDTLTKLDELDEFDIHGDTGIVQVGPNEALAHDLLFFTSEPTDRHIRRITWDNDGNITLGEYVLPVEDFTSAFGYWEYGWMDHIPGTRHALFYSGWYDYDPNYKVYLSVRAFDIDTMEAGPSCNLLLGDAQQISDSDALPLVHSASAGLTVDGQPGVFYVRWKQDASYAPQYVMTSLFVDSDLTVTAGDTQIIREGSVETGGYPELFGNVYRSTRLYYGQAFARWETYDSTPLDGFDHFAQGVNATGTGGFQPVILPASDAFYPWMPFPMSGSLPAPPNLAGRFVAGDRTFDP